MQRSAISIADPSEQGLARTVISVLSSVRLAAADAEFCISTGGPSTGPLPPGCLFGRGLPFLLQFW